MTRYFITIRKDQSIDEASGQTQIHVDLSSGQPRVTQVLVTAGSEGGLGSSDLSPNIDLDLLVRAFGEPSGAMSVGTESADRGPIPRQLSSEPDTGGARSYRKMPTPDEVLAVYAQTGTITGLAEYFGVPRHTAQGWAGRLRRQGFHIGRR